MSHGWAGFVAVAAGDARWQVLPHVRDALLGPDGLRLSEWLQAGQARVVKHGPHRSVYAVTLPGLSFFVKHNRLANARARLRELARPSKARVECRRALGVAARQVRTVTPLAVGECRRGSGKRESYLITASLDSSTPLDAFIDRTLPALPLNRQSGIRRRLAVALGVFLARMHEAGILHRDLHAGNVMVQLDEQDQPRLALLDLHSVQLGRPLAWPASRDNLVVFNRWCILHVGRTNRLRFWQAYYRARWESCAWPVRNDIDPNETMAHLARDLEARTRRSNFRFWRQRDRRCLRTNRYYRRAHAPDVVGHAVADLDPGLTASLLADPDEPFRRPGVTFLKDSPTSTVVEFDAPLGAALERVIYKRFRIKSWKAPWLSLLRAPPALRSWVCGHGLRDRGLATPRPLMVLHRRRAGMLREGYLLSLKVPDAVELPSFLDQAASLSPQARRAVLQARLEQIARLVRELHRRGVSHRDLKGANLLTTPFGEFESVAPRQVQRESYWPDVCVIDLVGVSLPRRLRHARRVQNLARLNASVGRHPALTRTDLVRFLRLYLQWGLFGRERWKVWWRSIEAATCAKRDRNARSGRPLH